MREAASAPRHHAALWVAARAGRNNYGQLGDGSTDSRLTPTAVLGSHTFSMITTGRYYTCGVKASGAAWCWGECGVVAYALVVSRGCGTAWLAVSGWRRVQCGLLPRALCEGGSWRTLTDRHRRMALRVAGCVGYNLNGQLGDGSTTDRSTPTAVSGSHTFSMVATGGYHTCGVHTIGAALCWGECGVGAHVLVV